MHASPSTAFLPCCSEDEVVRLVHTFYAALRRDPALGPIFERHVHDWDTHLAHLVDFWSAMLRGTRRFSGAPLARHLALPGLRQALFQRWLELFTETTTAIGNPVMKVRADARAAQIGQRFWQHYQLNRAASPGQPVAGARSARQE